MGKALPEAFAERARDAYFASNLTLDQLGVAMGYPAESARLDAWRFLYRTPAPTASAIRLFARAVHVPVKSLTA